MVSFHSYNYVLLVIIVFYTHYIYAAQAHPAKFGWGRCVYARSFLGNMFPFGGIFLGHGMFEMKCTVTHRQQSVRRHFVNVKM